MGGLRAKSARCRHFKARPRRRRIREEVADPGAADGSDCKHDRSSAQATGSGGRDQGSPSLHEHPRHPQTRGGSGDEPDARMLSRQSDDPPRIPVNDALERGAGTMTYLAAYIASLVVFFSVDMVWLSMMAGRIY